MDWKKTQGTQQDKPAEIETSEYLVYVRKNITQKTEEDEYGTHTFWEYDEVIIPKDDGLNIVKFSNEIYTAKLTEHSQAIDDILVDLLED